MEDVKKQTITSILKQFKPFDYVFIGLAILLSFFPAAFTWYQMSQEPPQAKLVAVVLIHGEVVDEFPLVKGGEHQEVTYHPSDTQYNIVEVDGDRIRVKEDNSPDQIAVNTGWISQKGQLSICLPHQLIIEIQSTGEEESDEDDEELILPI